jgi:ribosomal protein S1
MKIIDWGKIENQYPIGKVIDCKIISTHHYGVYVDINSDEVVGFVSVIDFSKKDRSRIEFPEIDSIVSAVIIDYSNDERGQIWLSLNPKIIQSPSIFVETMTHQEYFKTIIS